MRPQYKHPQVNNKA